MLSGRPQSVGWKPSIPREKDQRSLRSMEETRRMGYQRERKKEERKKDEESSVALKSCFLYPPSLIKQWQYLCT